MINRLHAPGRRLWQLVFFLLPLACEAQFTQTTQFFQFNFPGPNNIPVNGDCTGFLSMMATPVVTPLSPGASITQSYYDSVSTGNNNGYPPFLSVNEPFGQGNTINVYWQVLDNQGHSYNFQFPISFNDLTAPVFTGLPGQAVLNLISLKDVPPVPTVSANDNCDGPFWLYDFVETPRPPICQAGSFTRTWTSTDTKGNAATFTQTINIAADLTGPTITTFPQNGTVDCSANPQTAYSNWKSAQLAAITATDKHGILTKTISASNSIGTTCGAVETATFIVVDSCGNATSVDRTFSVTDSQPPVFGTNPATLIVNCNSGTDAASLAAWIQNRGGATATDNCAPIDWYMKIGGVVADSAAVQAAFDLSKSQACGPKTIDGIQKPSIRGLVTVEFVASDGCNAPSKSATFAVQDLQSPAFSPLPTDGSAACGGQTTLNDFVLNHGGGAASDICSGVIWTITPTPISGQCDGTKKWSVEFLVADACGNTNYATANFTLFDNVGPSINLPANPVLEDCGGGDDQAKLEAFIQNRASATLSDNCSNTLSWMPGFTWVNSTGGAGSGTTANGPYPQIAANDCSWWVDVTFGATDDCGNSSTKITRFQIVDGDAPVFATPITRDTFLCTQNLPSPVAPTVSDNCDPTVQLDLFTSIGQNPCSGRFDLIRTWKATDDCGNVAIATQYLVVIDTVGPVFDVFPADTVVDCGFVPPAATVGDGIEANDACGGAAQSVTSQDFSTQNPDPLDCGHYNYTVTRIFSAMDDCGNLSTRAQIIAVQDTAGPIFTQNLYFSTTCDKLVSFPAPVAVDGCGSFATDPVQVGADVIETLGCADHYLLKKTFSSTDLCGNEGFFTQITTVVDTVKPTLAGIPPFAQAGCGAVPNPPVIGQDITGADNCDPSVQILFSETSTQEPDPANCGHYNYWITREWLAVDNCLNSQQYSQTIQVEDKDAPVMELRPGGIIPTGLAQCAADVNFDAPLTLRDDCTVLADTVTVSQTEFLKNTSGLPDNFSPVDDVVLNISLVNTFPDQPATGGAAIALNIENFDGEQTTEIFEVYGENNLLLATTQPAPSQCGSVSMTLNLSEAQLNAWGQDGFITLTLHPVNDTTDAVNLICPGASATATMTYSYIVPQSPVVLTFTVDGGPVQSFPPPSSTSLPVGPHVVKMTATDCSGNSVSAIQNLEVVDVFPPTMEAPVDQSVFASDTCRTLVSLPFPQNLSDNCGFSGSFDQNLPSKLLTFKTDPNAGKVPNDVVLTFTGAIANAITGGTLTIPLLADNGDIGEFFQIFDENGLPLGQTGQGTAQCASVSTTTLPVTAQQINSWAADGIVKFTLKANTDATVWSDFINPCGTLNGASQDGTSTVGGRLKYEFAPVFFEIKSPGGAVVKSGQLVGNQTVVSVPAGQYEVDYSVTDRNGLTGSTLWNLEVRDTTRPVALCKLGSQVYVNPSGLDDYQVAPQSIDDGSHDNCSTTLSYSVYPPSFPCSVIGAFVAVDLTVADEWGNSSTCSTVLFANGAPPVPSYAGNICQNDTLRLYANAPNDPTNGAFTYLWTAPNGNQFTVENPVIPTADLSYEGAWSVLVTGITGCQSTGLVNVSLVHTPTTPVLTATQPAFCDGEPIVLKTQNYTGQNPTFYWYSGQFPTGTLLGTTITAQFLVPSAQVGTNDFYVMVRENGCLSNPSAALAVPVYAIPAAAVVTPGMTVCEGLPIALGTSSGGANTSYSWSGPNGFSSNLQYPPVILSAKPVVHEGIYQVVISENGCQSSAAAISVAVKPRPATPEIGTDLPKCTGQTVQLVSNVTNAEQYLWFSPLYPSVEADTTTVNGLSIFNAQPSESGGWRLVIIKQGCPSDTSNAGQVLVKDFPSLAPANNGPLCEGAPANFFATTNQATGSIFQWSGPAGFSSFTQNPTLNQPAAGVYNVTVTNDIGCSATGQSLLQISAQPVIAALVSNAPICEDASQSVQLQALISPADPTYIYSWTGPNGWTSSDPSPVLPTATVAINGSYTLSVTKNLGANLCVSNPKSTTISIIPTPKTPSITQPAAICAGQPFTIVVANPGDYPPGATYIWDTPIGLVSTATPNFTISNSNIGYAGDYLLEVQVNGCKSAASPVVALTVHPIPGVPTVTTNSPVCEGDQIELSVPLMSNTTYQWFGPNSFSSSLHNPVIPNCTMANAGEYFVKIAQFGCESNFTEPIKIVVKPRAAVPTLSGTAQICLDAPGATLQLSINQPSQTAGATYNWYQYINPQNALFLVSSATATGINYSNLGGFSQGIYQFVALADLNGCASAASLPFEVSMFEIPANKANAGIDQLGCTGSDLTLAAQVPTIGTGFWTQVGGTPLSIANPNVAATTASGNMAPGNFLFKWTLSNGACLNYSSDSVFIAVNDFEMADGGAQLDTCFATSVQLHAVPSLNGNGFWTQPAVQNLLGVTIVDPSDPNTVVSGLTPGNIYTFSWNLPDQGCGPTTSDVLVRIINSEAFAGGDRLECSDDGCAIVAAAAPGSFETGTWTSPDPLVSFANPSAPVTDVCGLKSAQNILIWTLNNGTCGSHAVDTLLLTIEPTPVAHDDVIQVAFGDEVEIDAVANDLLPGAWTISTDIPVGNGRLTDLGSGVFTYQPNIGYSGADQFKYTICNTICANACSSATVSITVAQKPDCELPTIITPNGDGVNDVFYVPCIHGAPGEKSEVSIFNEWGSEVFHAQPYKNDWAGEYNGQPVPAGTYFYVVRMDGSAGVSKGFLVVQR